MVDDKLEKDKLLTSNYDGIQEYDNNLPKWWLYLFYFTIVWSAVYPFYFHGNSENQTLNILNAELKELVAAKPKDKDPGSDTAAIEIALLAKTKDSAAIDAGKAVFQTRCLACHGANGEGLIGPNLTDNYFIHGPKILDAKHIVENGVLDKGMLAWKGVITSEQIDQVVAYVWTLRGSNPANAKAPQGEPAN